jgi:hypothetical protein
LKLAKGGGAAVSLEPATLRQLKVIPPFK